MQEAVKRLLAAELMCLAPHVCKAIYKGEPLPIGYSHACR